jgi:hypothetical protein
MYGNPPIVGVVDAPILGVVDVEKIVAVFKAHGSPTQYKVRFVGLPPSNDMWYTEAALTEHMPQDLFDDMLTYWILY